MRTLGLCQCGAKRAPGISKCERCHAHNCAWLRRNRDKARVYVGRWKDANPTASREWFRKNPEKAQQYARARRARRRSATGSLTAAEWLAIVKKQRYRCFVCREKRPLTADHIVPLSRGGCAFAFNVQGLCGPCNSKKHASLDAVEVSLFDRIA
ncbi:MAG: HNH endonuclease [Patescibacteria group bacterium]|nr:HNH endonuclease [Patescibacteria group bacterium]